MIFGDIDHVLLLGGSRATAELALALKARGTYRFDVFTAPRQQHDAITEDGETFGAMLSRSDVPYHVAEDINTDARFLAAITPKTLALGVGEAWSFEPDVIRRFDGRLLDLMGIPLPQFRGGAHYTWMILQGSRRGACNLQVVNEEMQPGVFDSGAVLKRREYHFPASARIPADYFAHAITEEVPFILEFLDEVAARTEFAEHPIQESASLYMPRLNTREHAFVDWQWPTLAIERMICAFDRPYIGVGTSINGNPVRVRGARSETNDGPFHPFQCGVIYRIADGMLFVCTRDGTLLIDDVRDGDGHSVKASLRLGDRFATPVSWLEKSMALRLHY